MASPGLYKAWIVYTPASTPYGTAALREACSPLPGTDCHPSRRAVVQSVPDGKNQYDTEPSPRSGGRESSVRMYPSFSDAEMNSGPGFPVSAYRMDMQQSRMIPAAIWYLFIPYRSAPDAIILVVRRGLFRGTGPFDPNGRVQEQTVLLRPDPRSPSDHGGCQQGS